MTKAFYMQSEKKSFPITILKLFPGIISILIIVAGSIGLFKGQSKYYTLPIFLVLIGAHIILSIKYKLADKWLFYIYLSIAIVFIMLRIFIS
jgi:low affinity Fe/Cu permease